jgi:uncharacterized protein YcnI
MRKLVIFVAALAAVLAAAAPAWAHEEINPKQFPTGQPTFLTLNAANEKQVDLNKITLTAPAGVKFGAATHEPPGWAVNRTDAVITWSGGAVKPDRFEQWGYEIEGADQPGTLTYKVGLGFADNSSNTVNVQVTAVPAGTTPIPGGAPTIATTASTAAPAKSSNGNAARTRANVALGLGAVALAASLVALGLAARKRSSGAAGPAATSGSRQKQDW